MTSERTIHEFTPNASLTTFVDLFNCEQQIEETVSRNGIVLKSLLTVWKRSRNVFIHLDYKNGKRIKMTRCRMLK